mmetsp:Transcript_83828/g.195021  ORF Transcript_83828/g.195021 Transcript_83828/m.195021 type:complete len:478 (-) Transcript_83828:64-1497(-)
MRGSEVCQFAGSGSMANLLTLEQLAEMREAFDLFASVNGGTLPTSSLGTVMRSLGVNPNEAALEEVNRTAGPQGLSFPEFVEIFADGIVGGDVEEELVEAFRVFDRTGHGTITSAEVRHVMIQLGERLTDDEIDELIREADLGDGMIDYTEFTNLLLGADPAYVPLVPRVYALGEAALAPAFVSCVQEEQGSWRELCTTVRENVFAFPFLTEDFCRNLLAELQHLQHRSASALPGQHPSARPYRVLQHEPGTNTLRNVSRRLESLGLNVLCAALAEQVQPLCAASFPWLCAAGALARHHCFCVRYCADGCEVQGSSAALPLHEDDSLLTVNICLASSCQGGEVLYGPASCSDHFTQLRARSQHELTPTRASVGWATLHLGCQEHAANAVTEGERHSLVMWLRCAGDTSSYGEEGRLSLKRLRCTQRWCQECAANLSEAAAALSLSLPQTVLGRSSVRHVPLPPELTRRALGFVWDLS